MSDTLWIDEKMYVVDDEVAVYCEKLEDELAEAKANHRAGTETAIRIHAKQEAEIAELKQKFITLNKELGCELSDPNGTIWEHAAKVQKENAELKTGASSANATNEPPRL
jgi:SMC interacting uncharacterized protein involved in chromosome segregation